MALVLLAACNEPADTVELRLEPCPLPGGVQAGSVRLEIQGYDADGQPVGDALGEGFSIPSGALDDGVATVGYRRPSGVVTADFTVGWFVASPAGPVSGADARADYVGTEVPGLGESLTLGVSGCGGDGDGDGDGTTGGDGDGTTGGDPDTSTTSDSSGTTGATGSATTDPGTSSDGGTTSGSTGGETTAGGGTTGGSTTGGMGGEDCSAEGVGAFFCEELEGAAVGTLLECDGAQWQDADLGAACDAICDLGGYMEPVGCSGPGAVDWVCVCNEGTDCGFRGPRCAGGQAVEVCLDDKLGIGVCLNGCMNLPGGGGQCG